MQLREALAARRTVRNFSSDPIPNETLCTVLEAGLAMPHAGNTYDWRAIVLESPQHDHPAWDSIFDGVLRQEYLADAPVLVIWAVQPHWWAAQFRGNMDQLVSNQHIDRSCAGDLFDVADRPVDYDALFPALIGELMLAVGAVVLAATDAGLGTALSACQPDRLATALGLPSDAYVAPFGVLALGYRDSDRVQDASRSAHVSKPCLVDVCYSDRWGVPFL